MIRDARLYAGLDVGGALLGQGIQNRRSGKGGSFFTPAGLGKTPDGSTLGRLDVGSYGRYNLDGSIPG